MTSRRPLLTFYGDDFTGSADLVLQYQRFGLQGKIFLGDPSREELQAAAAEFSVVGVAGVTRALGPEEISAAIEPALRALVALEPDFMQYKVCSTADSSPTIGSFAPAIRIGRELCGDRPVPVLVAQPGLGRYTVFSNHFAVDRGQVYRLDRQPVMSKHPVTPMTESDLRMHLALQIDGPIGAVTLTELHGADGGESSYRKAQDDNLVAVIVDALTEDDLRKAGELFMKGGRAPVFGIGSGGFSVAVARALGFTEGAVSSRLTAMAGPCLAVSGSCSPLTSDQIRYALAHGWHGIPLDVRETSATPGSALQLAADEALALLQEGRNVVVYTCGDDQQMIGAPVSVTHLADALAFAVIYCAERTLLSRVLIAGGDTSGHVVMALGATAMTSKSPVGKHTLLCELEAENEAINGLEVVLKGGQIGGEDFFEFVRIGDWGQHEQR